MHKSWGNAIWFEDAIEEMGADVMRWMYAGQVPAQNLNFGYGPAKDVKRRLLTLWHTYAFFVTYANINDFSPRFEALEAGPEAARPLDRWFAARVQVLVRECRGALDAYDSPRLVRAFEAYVDDLSLWYALVQGIRCVAPVMPFLADEMWQNLVRGPCAGAPESVHHSAYPEAKAELLDEELLTAMENARAVVELGRAARDAAGIRLRQPLAEVI